jgi:hypothetical protein
MERVEGTLITSEWIRDIVVVPRSDALHFVLIAVIFPDLGKVIHFCKSEAIEYVSLSLDRLLQVD